ncbi:MAG: EF-hand domain-containing protein [Magnetococcales bacterium]|nr:EF-hand domain-containing protein [Magnetococcales bacterium]
MNIGSMSSMSSMGGMGGMGKPPSASDLMSKLDTNSDGFLSLTEAKGPLAKDFSTADTNGDKKLSSDELQQLLTAHSQSQGNGMQGMTPPSAADLMSRMDTNQDGSISADEAQGPLKDRFKIADSNNDGKVTTEELQKDMNASRQEMPTKAAGADGGAPPQAAAGAGGGAPPPQAASGSESSSSQDSQYDPADTNKDGIVSEAELAKYQISHPNKHQSSTSTTDASSSKSTHGLTIYSNVMSNYNNSNDSQISTLSQLVA